MWYILKLRQCEKDTKFEKNLRLVFSQYRQKKCWQYFESVFHFKVLPLNSNTFTKNLLSYFLVVVYSMYCDLKIMSKRDAKQNCFSNFNEICVVSDCG